MQAVEAIYQDGVFKPLGELQLPENERVVLMVRERTNKEEAIAWFQRMQEKQDRFATQRGFLPDSTLDIAEDRTRDV